MDSSSGAQLLPSPICVSVQCGHSTSCQTFIKIYKDATAGDQEAIYKCLGVETSGRGELSSLRRIQSSVTIIAPHHCCCFVSF